ncbi:hypothetical protein LTR70_003201 [Exophiala xenobiotica]|uniref:Uncharacterized protein n=1 Tax=Lithohypha guttulata TaxID=1690604 RepID=A0ABR0KGK3_9EURO|nr:hypothetical protein LTR24_002846 [Lithohypha guttulata]KAK5323713.1 hypothetical protein LTR70_003201 [Exophiala xenobiotica]
MEFNMRGYQAVIIPHLPANWEQVIGRDTASDLVSSNPNVGIAWVSSEAKVDPATGFLTNVLSAANHSGAYSYYPRTKQELADVATLQAGDAEDHAGIIQKLSPDFKRDLIRYLSAPTTNEAYTFALISMSKPSVEHLKRQADRDQDGPREAHQSVTVSESLRKRSEESRNMGVSLARTCRLLNADVKSMWLVDNIFMFYCPDQLNRFLKSTKPGSVLLSSWPRTFKHIVLVVKDRDSDPYHKKAVRHTTVVPLSPKAYPSPKDKKNDSDAGPSALNPVVTAGVLQTALLTTPSTHQYHPNANVPAAWYHIPAPIPASNQTPSDKDDQAYDEKRKQPVQPPETAGYRSDMLQWYRRVERSLLTANLNLKHQVRKGTDTANRNENNIPLFPSLADARRQSEQVRLSKLARKQSDVQGWYQGVKDLLETYKVERLDIVYEDGQAWLMAHTNGLGGTDLSRSQTGSIPEGLETFVAPEYERVMRFLGILFGGRTTNSG